MMSGLLKNMLKLLGWDEYLDLKKPIFTFVYNPTNKKPFKRVLIKLF